MIQWIIDNHKNNWHLMLFPTLWAYRTLFKTTMGFMLFHLIHYIEIFLPIKCEIHTFHSAIERLPDTFSLEKWMLSLE